MEKKDMLVSFIISLIIGTLAVVVTCVWRGYYEGLLAVVGVYVWTVCLVVPIYRINRSASPARQPKKRMSDDVEEDW